MSEQKLSFSPISASDLRKYKSSEDVNQSISLHLPYREPFNWPALLEFLEVRAIPGVEQVVSDVYQRVIQIGDKSGMILVSAGNRNNSRPVIKVKTAFPELNKLHYISEKIISLFDLDAPAEEIDKYLKKDPLLKSSIQKNGGLRVPGCWDQFELCIRAILGQQISVKGATTISGRIVEKYGKEYIGPVFNDNHQKWFTFPKPSVLKDAGFEGLGLTKSRIATIKSLATAVYSKKIDFEQHTESDIMVNQLKEIKGIGDWTAQYIAMRALRDPNAFPASDLGLIKAVSTTSEKIKPKYLEKLSQKWTPWRATAAMYLWRSL